MKKEALDKILSKTLKSRGGGISFLKTAVTRIMRFKTREPLQSRRLSQRFLIGGFKRCIHAFLLVGDIGQFVFWQ